MNNLNNKISAGTIRPAPPACCWPTNQILSACGSRAAIESAPWSSWSPLASPPWPRWWPGGQNNSFTAAAIQADKYLEDKKSQVNK